MKLGNMQQIKPYKFLQEQVFEGIWPFSKLRSPGNVGLLTLFYFLWGMIIYYLYDIDPYLLIAGLFSALSISVWTLGIFRYANMLREAKVEKLNAVNRKFLTQYLDALFHPSSIVLGIILFVFTIVFFLASYFSGATSIMTRIEMDLGNSSIPPFILFYLFLISFDICYRLGLSSYVMFTQIRRNFWLEKYLRNPRLSQQFVPRNIKALANADKYHYLALGGGIFLIPMLVLDPLLFLGLCVYLIVSFIVATYNLIHLNILHTKAIPKDVKNLLCCARFAYVGTVSEKSVPHITPSLFVFDGRHVFLATSIKSQKVKNLRIWKKIAVCIEYRKGEDVLKSQGVLIQGKARIYGHNTFFGLIYVLFTGLRMLLIRNLFTRKYPDYLIQYSKNNQNLPRAWRTLPILSRTIIEIIPDRFIYWKGPRFSRIKF
ncbi:MAG: pyridoxamine 5'-phosphate oxidase family protein [Candidatus Hodarchaeales archaeon]